MSEALTATKVTDHVYWVGAIDRDLREFHGYRTGRGTTYNAFLVMADRVTLIDTVKAGFEAEMFERIASVTPIETIDVIVSNHAEMDHSGAMAETIARAKPEAIYASRIGVKALAEHFHWDVDVQAVKPGQPLDLGNVSLDFIETPLLHWPDSMFTYLEADALLFSQDAFGMHLASDERFADQVDDAAVKYETAKYFANIVLPFSTQVRKSIAKVLKQGKPIDVIAPDHGPMWRGDTQPIVVQYDQWAQQAPTRKAVVVYDTMWKSTEAMAEAVAEGLSAGGAQPVVMSLRQMHRSDVATEILEAGALVVGTPTMNGGMYPTVADVLHYLKGLARQNLVGGVFGSYGWSATALTEAASLLEAMDVELIGEPARVRHVPDAAALARARDLGVAVARALCERVGRA